MTFDDRMILISEKGSMTWCKGEDIFDRHLLPPTNNVGNFKLVQSPLPILFHQLER